MAAGRFVFVLELFALLQCGGRTEAPPISRSDGRGMRPAPRPTPAISRQSVDWSQSAGLFVGIQQFHRNSGLDAQYATDDAVDLAYLLIRELGLLPADRAVILLAGRPIKSISRHRLDELTGSVLIIEDDQGPLGVAKRQCLDEEAISVYARAQARKVRGGGLLVISISTHGFTVDGQHRLLTADASLTEARGVVVARLIDAIQSEGASRLLLLIDACRVQTGALTWSAPNWRAGLPQTWLQDLKLDMPYAVLSAATPGGIAIVGADVKNGFFTRAVIEGLSCKASSLPDGWVTLSNLDAYVSERVGTLSHGYQQTESRFGGLGSLRIRGCGAPECGEIIAPRPNESVQARGPVELRVSQRELYAVVMVCAGENNVCYNESPGLAAISTDPDSTTRINVSYGRPDTFRVIVVLSRDPNFLRNQTEWPSPPDLKTDGVVCIVGPVQVTRFR